MSDEPKFVEVARFSSRMEAETIGHALDSHDIPFIVQSSDVGIFGPGMTGPTLLGAALMVPSNRADEVADLLNCVVQPLAEGELGGSEATADTAVTDDSVSGGPGDIPPDD